MEEQRAYAGRKARFRRLIFAPLPDPDGAEKEEAFESAPENGGRLNPSPNQFTTFAGQRAWREQNAFPEEKLHLSQSALAVKNCSGFQGF